MFERLLICYVSFQKQTLCSLSDTIMDIKDSIEFNYDMFLPLVRYEKYFSEILYIIRLFLQK